MSKELLTVEQASTILEIPVSAVEELIDTHQLAATCEVGEWGIHVDELNAYSAVLLRQRARLDRMLDTCESFDKLVEELKRMAEEE